MDIEQLKLIINTINSLGANAKEGFIWWLVVDKVPGMLFGVAWTVILAYVIKRGLDMVRGVLASSRLMESAGVTVYWSNKEINRACAILRKYFRDPNALP
jgi:hypothetical protein